jgi:NAD(P)-dependent dehydrogenase (short-subunit alcohol dehydrogenase family)
MARASFDFSGTTTVVTGGASGIGFTCADLIVRCGGNVIISASRNPEKTNQALTKLRAVNPGVKAQAFPCEVGSEKSVEQFFRAIKESGEQQRGSLAKY